jgi:methyl-accepting chemotaxis protein
MSRPKVKTALTGILILLGAAFAIFATFAINRLGAIDGHLTAIATNSMPSVVSVKDMEVQVTNIRNSYRSHILRPDAEGKASAAQSIDSARAALDGDIKKFGALGPSPQEEALVKAVEDAMDSYIGFGARVIELSNAGDVQGANNILRTDMVSPAD